VVARYSKFPLRVAALRRNSREIVDGERPSCRAISRTPLLRTRSRAICSRSTNDKYRPDVGGDDDARCDGGIPPHSRNHLTPTAGDTPALCAASSLEHPSAIACQNGRRSDRFSTGGRPGDRIFARPARSAPHFRVPINTSDQEVLRRWVEFTQFTAKDFIDVLREHQIGISMDGKGCWRDNVFVERPWKTIKYEHVYLHAYESVSDARAKLAVYIDFYNRRRPHSSIDRRTPDDAYFDVPSLKAAA
jgi:putative transposase